MKPKYSPIILIAIIVLASIFSIDAEAQCQNCEPKNVKVADFCFQHPLFSNFCAQFLDQANSFTLYVNGKPTEIPIYDDIDTKYFVDLANNKKLKLDAANILFIQEALKTWKVESKKIGFNFTSSGLGIKILEQGTGSLPEHGKIVKVHYTGYLEDGKKFDSSVERGTPFEFPLGTGRVIKGWDEGIALLNVGTKAILQIPPDLGYGSRGAGGVIPPDAILYFEIEVLSQ